MQVILFIIGSLMLLATLLPFIPRDVWWIRSFDFPRLQIACLIIIIFAAYLPYAINNGAVNILFEAALLLALLYQCYMMLPYTFLSSAEVQVSENPTPETNISFIFANVQMDNRNSEKLKKIIRENNPDIVLTAEVDDWWLDQLSELEQRYTYTVQQPQDNCYGMALYSKLELLDPEVQFLIEDGVPSIYTKTKLESGKVIEIHCLHPEPPFITGDATSTERDAELLLVGKKINNKIIPTIVMGDMNDVAWSHTTNLFQKVSGLLDPRAGRGFFNSFHAKYPFMRFPLDHIFHTHHFRLVDFKCLPHIRSDHFPVYIKLSFEPDAEIEQNENEANAREHETAEEKIENGTD